MTTHLPDEKYCKLSVELVICFFKIIILDTPCVLDMADGKVKVHKCRLLQTSNTHFPIAITTPAGLECFFALLEGSKEG